MSCAWDVDLIVAFHKKNYQDSSVSLYSYTYYEGENCSLFLMEKNTR